MALRAMEMGLIGQISPKVQADEQDRRYANLEYELERLQAAGRAPATGADWQSPVPAPRLRAHAPLVSLST